MMRNLLPFKTSKSCACQAVSAVSDKPVQEQLKESVLEDGLESHSTQGSHGMNYHHPEQGDTGYQFFMPSCEFHLLCWNSVSLNPLTAVRG